MQGDAPRDRAPHKWQCTRPPLEDHYRRDPKTGEAAVVRRCPSCGAVERPAKP
jgi:hypothetical protein